MRLWLVFWCKINNYMYTNIICNYYFNETPYANVCMLLHIMLIIA